MSDKALDKAKSERDQMLARKQALAVELAEVSDRLARAERFIADWHAFAGVEPPQPSPESTESGAKSADKRAARNSKKEDVAEMARVIIEEAGEPVSRTDLYHRLVERGLRIDGTDPEMVLSTMMWRMRARVVRLKSGGYWLADKPYEPAGYVPHDLFG